MQECPFDYTKLDDRATVCPGCHAVKGYSRAQETVYGKVGTIGWGIIFPAILALFIGGLFRGGTGILVVWLIAAIPIVLSAIALLRGPRWYR